MSLTLKKVKSESLAFCLSTNGIFHPYKYSKHRPRIQGPIKKKEKEKKNKNTNLKKKKIENNKEMR